MEKSQHASATASIEAMRTQIQARRRLRELQSLTRPTDDERDEAWLLLRSIRTLAKEARKFRLNEAKVRLATFEMPRTSAKAAQGPAGGGSDKTSKKQARVAVPNGTTVGSDQI